MNFSAITLELGVLGLALGLLAAELLLPEKETRRSLGYALFFGLIGLFFYAFSLYHLGANAHFYEGLFVLDNYALFFKQLCILGAAWTALLSLDYVEALPRYRGEFYPLLSFALLGMLLLASANDFLTLFVGLELMTISFYILVGYRLGDALSSEAGVKYLMIGSASTAVLLYGVSLLYGATGALSFAEIHAAGALTSAVGIAGIALTLAGFFFKLSIVPFHMWSPDVYQGAPTPVTGLLAMGSKAAALAAFMRVLFTALPDANGYWLPLVALLAAVSMAAGNLMALGQQNVKRLLAYSSIAQAGYMLVGVAAADAAGVKSVLFYALLYAFANIGAFAVLTAVDRQTGGAGLNEMAGLARRAPLLAAVMTVSLLSMAGIPPTAGFAGKLYLFSAAVDQGYLWLAFAGFILSMLSVYYYLQVVKAMYMAEGEGAPLSFSGATRATALISAAATLLIGICPDWIAALTNFAAYTFFQ